MSDMRQLNKGVKMTFFKIYKADEKVVAEIMGDSYRDACIHAGMNEKDLMIDYNKGTLLYEPLRKWFNFKTLNRVPYFRLEGFDKGRSHYNINIGINDKKFSRKEGHFIRSFSRDGGNSYAVEGGHLVILPFYFGWFRDDLEEVAKYKGLNELVKQFGKKFK